MTGDEFNMKKRYYIILAAVLLCVSLVYSIAVGSRYVLDIDIQGYSDNAEATQIIVEQDTEIIKIKEQKTEGDHLYITLESVFPGKASVMVVPSDNHDVYLYFKSVYVHHFGVITEENLFGRSTGSWCFPVAMTIFLAALIIGLFIHIKKEIRQDLYQYKNVRNIGFALFLTSLFAEQLILLTRMNNGIIDSVDLLLGSAGFFSRIMLPAAFITFILVTISNIQLMRKE